MFGLNWGELVVIGIVALIAIGPKELPTVLRTIGQWTGKIRRMANEFQGQFQEALREAELTDLQKHAEDISSSVTDLANIDPLAEEQKEIERIGEGAGNLPSGDLTTEPAAETQVALVAEPAPTEPDVSVPMPEMPPLPTEKDFAPAKPQVSEEVPEAAPAKQAGGGA
jgi:sec-independent protein translocase protein TatB